MTKTNLRFDVKWVYLLLIDGLNKYPKNEVAPPQCIKERKNGLPLIPRIGFWIQQVTNLKWRITAILLYYGRVLERKSSKRNKWAVLHCSARDVNKPKRDHHHHYHNSRSQRKLYVMLVVKCDLHPRVVITKQTTGWQMHVGNCVLLWIVKR